MSYHIKMELSKFNKKYIKLQGRGVSIHETTLRYRITLKRWYTTI